MTTRDITDITTVVESPERVVTTITFVEHSDTQACTRELTRTLAWDDERNYWHVTANFNDDSSFIQGPHNEPGAVHQAHNYLCEHHGFTFDETCDFIARLYGLNRLRVVDPSQIKRYMRASTTKRAVAYAGDDYELELTLATGERVIAGIKEQVSVTTRRGCRYFDVSLDTGEDALLFTIPKNGQWQTPAIYIESNDELEFTQVDATNDLAHDVVQARWIHDHNQPGWNGACIEP